MRILSFIFVIFSVQNAYGQVQTPKYGNEFLAIGVGGRALGMGNTNVAVANDATAGYWNPAGLIDQENKYDIILQHGEYFSGIAKYDYLAFSTKLDTVSNLAFSIIRFGIDDIPDTRFLYDANGAINYDNIRFFTAADYGFISSYARKINWLGGLQLGGNFKIIYRKAGDFAQAWGFGLDIGAKLKVKKWQLGAVFRDATGTFTAWSHNTDAITSIFSQTGNDIPQNSVEVTVPRLILGAGYTFEIKKFSFLSTIDLVLTFDGERNTLVKSSFASIDPTFGLEVDYSKIAYLRFGIRNVQQLQDFDKNTYMILEPTFGLGFHYNIISIDYALTSVGPQTRSLYSHIFSVRLNFDGKE